MNNCNDDINIYNNALQKIKNDQKFKPTCCITVGPTGPTGPTGPSGGPTGPTHTVKSVNQ